MADDKIDNEIDSEKGASGQHSPDASQIEKAGVAHGYSDPSYVDHRDNDDRADEAKGRNADKFDKSYWLSWRYIGTLFAIGMAFMGGIGGECSPSLVHSVAIAAA